MLGSAPAEVVPVRLDPELKRAVETREKNAETTVSEIIREALRRLLEVAKGADPRAPSLRGLHNAKARPAQGETRWHA